MENFIKNEMGRAINILKAFSNERRLTILCALHESEKNVGELEKIIGVSQSALSQHLARLRRDGIVSTRRDAQTIYYSLNDDAARRFLSCLSDVCDMDMLDRAKKEPIKTL